MEPSPSRDADIHSAAQEIPLQLWKQNVHYCVHKIPPADTVLS